MEPSLRYTSTNTRITPSCCSQVRPTARGVCCSSLRYLCFCFYKTACLVGPRLGDLTAYNLSRKSLNPDKAYGFLIKSRNRMSIAKHDVKKLEKLAASCEDSNKLEFMRVRNLQGRFSRRSGWRSPFNSGMSSSACSSFSKQRFALWREKDSRLHFALQKSCQTRSFPTHWNTARFVQCQCNICREKIFGGGDTDPQNLGF